MKKFLICLFIFVCVAGCSTLGRITDEPANRGIAYGVGRSAGIAIFELSKKSIPALEKRYDRFYAESKNMTMIPSEMTISLANDLALILVREVDDPYMLLNDLTYFLGLFGAQFIGTGEQKRLTAVDMIPRAMFVSFGSGWDMSIWMMKRLAESDQ